MTLESTETWSLPDTAVIDAIESALDDGEEAVLATIVAVDGNAYRRPGAKMLVTTDGGFGSITAGCLEEEVRSVASRVRSSNSRIVERFDLTGDDDVWGLGLGCNGVIDMLFEPLEEDYRAVVDAYRDGVPTATMTVLDDEREGLRQGQRLVAKEGSLGTVEAGRWPPDVLDSLSTPVETLLANEQSETITVGETGASTRVFVDTISPPPDLVIFGSGPDVHPVTDLARKADFRVTVASFRGGHATADRFPHADRVLSTSPATVLEDLSLDEESYAVVMTHNFVDDQVVFEELLASEVPYIGLIGPEERFEELLEALDEETRAGARRERERLYTPIGLDLGGGTPYQIALSIVAEVQVVANDRDPQHLRNRGAPIHERVAVEQD